jgi:hypothetical protein
MRKSKKFLIGGLAIVTFVLVALGFLPNSIPTAEATCKDCVSAGIFNPCVDDDDGRLAYGGSKCAVNEVDGLSEQCHTDVITGPTGHPLCTCTLGAPNCNLF